MELPQTNVKVIWNMVLALLLHDVVKDVFSTTISSITDSLKKLTGDRNVSERFSKRLLQRALARRMGSKLPGSNRQEGVKDETPSEISGASRAV